MKETSIWSITPRTVITVIVIGVLWSCSHTKAPHTEKALKETRGTTVVLPFIDMARVFGSNTSVRGPISSKVFLTGSVDEKADLFLTNELYRLLGQEKKLKWGFIPQKKIPIHFSVSDRKVLHLNRLKAIGREKGADTLMIGYLYVFRDREGGAYGVEKPAQVVFELVLIRTDTGRIVWQRSYRETQKALSEDLLQLKTFIKRKGRWISAKEMSAMALKEMLKTAPHFRTH
jgi:hypothetical protein